MEAKTWPKGHSHEVESAALLRHVFHNRATSLLLPQILLLKVYVHWQMSKPELKWLLPF
jgi:hypothetical protein